MSSPAAYQESVVPTRKSRTLGGRPGVRVCDVDLCKAPLFTSIIRAKKDETNLTTRERTLPRSVPASSSRVRQQIYLLSAQSISRSSLW